MFGTRFNLIYFPLLLSIGFWLRVGDMYLPYQILFCHIIFFALPLFVVTLSFLFISLQTCRNRSVGSMVEIQIDKWEKTNKLRRRCERQQCSSSLYSQIHVIRLRFALVNRAEAPQSTVKQDSKLCSSYYPISSLLFIR